MATLTMTRAERRTLDIKQWMVKRNEWFSAVCGEEFTNKEVLLMHLYGMALIVVCGVAEWLEGGVL